MRLYKALWMVAWYVLIRPFPRNSGNKWEIFLLKLFGAKIGNSCIFYSSAKIHIPKYLIVEDNVCIANNVQMQNTAIIHIKSNVIISQGSYLCTGSHDIWHWDFAQYSKPIIVEQNVWIAADCFVGPGVTIGEGAVLSARTVIFESVKPWSVMTGNPGKFLIKRRIS